ASWLVRFIVPGSILAFLADRVFLLPSGLAKVEELDRFCVHVYPTDELSMLPEHSHQHARRRDVGRAPFWRRPIKALRRRTCGQLHAVWGKRRVANVPVIVIMRRQFFAVAVAAPQQQ